MKPERPWLELQIHPPDIRRGVRYLFLTARQLGGVALLLVLLAGGMAWSLIVAPGVLRGVHLRQTHATLTAARMQQGRRLQGLLQRMQTLSGQSEELRLRMEKLHLAYGLENEEAAGKGGFPFAPRAVPDSIYGEMIRHANELEAQIAEELQVVGVFLSEVDTFEEHNQDQVINTPSISPVDGRSFVLTSPFGTRRNPFTKASDFHAGLDLAAPEGTPIRAPADAVVVFAGRYDLRQSVAWWRYGNLVVLRHGSRFVTLYGHCRDVRVRKGQQVRQGEVIASVGNTGWSTAPHLHYEVRRRLDDGELEPVDPRIYILDHRWRDEEKLLVRARATPQRQDYEPLPRLLR